MENLPKLQRWQNISFFVAFVLENIQNTKYCTFQGGLVQQDLRCDSSSESKVHIAKFDVQRN